MKCEAENGICKEEAVELAYVEGWEGDSDIPLCKKHKEALMKLQENRPKGLGPSPYRYKPIS